MPRYSGNAGRCPNTIYFFFYLKLLIISLLFEHVTYVYCVTSSSNAWRKRKWTVVKIWPEEGTERGASGRGLCVQGAIAER